MGKKQGLTPDQETAYHLEQIAAAVREGNAWAIGEARSMLAHRALRAALERARDEGCPICNGDCGSANSPVYDCSMQVINAALAKATGEPVDRGTCLGKGCAS